MVLKVIFCPHCNKKMQFNVKKEDLDFSGRLPTPIYVKHDICGQFSTLYLDSKLRVSRYHKGKQDCSNWKFVKNINSEH